MSRHIGPEHSLRWFGYDHLEGGPRLTSKRFAVLADWICDQIEPGPQREIALQKLLEAKDAAVRATLCEGG